MSNKRSHFSVISVNKKAKFDYYVIKTFEAGIVLNGSEVKSIRTTHPSIIEVYAGLKKSEVYLFNFTIPPWKFSSNILDPTRPKKLLLHEKEIKFLIGHIQQKGETLLALQLYFNDRGRCKILLGLGKGKTKYDKRQVIKKRDWERQKQLLIKN